MSAGIDYNEVVYLPKAKDMPTAKSFSKQSTTHSGANTNNWIFLNANQIGRIDRALVAIGDFGEVRLIKEKGNLKFIQKLASEDFAENQDSR